VIPKHYIDQFLTDRKTLSEFDFFKPSRGTQDAASYLNSRISWDTEKFTKGSLALPDELLQEMKDKNWHEKSLDFEKLNLDFSWMRELHQFDYWSMELDSPVYPKEKKILPLNYHILIIKNS
jgi:hypothetical protein